MSQAGSMVFVLKSTGLGGAELATLELMKACKRRGCAIAVISHKPGKLADAFTEVADGKHLVVPFSYPRQPMSLLRLPSLKKQGRAFIKTLSGPITFFSPDFLSLWAVLQLRESGQRVISLWQGEYEFDNPSCVQKWMQYGAEEADVVCACGPVAEHVNLLGILKKPVRVLNPRIDLARFDPAQYEVTSTREKLGIAPDAKLAVCAGRIGEGKGQFALAKAFSKSELAPSWQLVFAGPASEEDGMRLQTLCRDSQSMRWLGPIGNVPELLSAANLAILPGTCHESFGLSHLESILMGLPLLTFPVGAVPRVLGERYSGLVKPVGDIQQLMACWGDAEFLDTLSEETQQLQPALRENYSDAQWETSLDVVLG